MATSSPDPECAGMLRAAFADGIRAVYRYYGGDPECAREYALGATAGAEDIADAAVS